MKRKILPLQKLAKRIRTLSKESSHTLTEVLDYAGIPAQYISKWEKETGRPRRAPYYTELAQLAEILEKPIEVFIYDDPGDPYVMIPKKRYEEMTAQIRKHLSQIKQEVSKAEESEIFNIDQYLA